MVVFSYYPLDARVRREAEALVDEGMEVDVICMPYQDEPLQEVVERIGVYRVQLKRKHGGKLRYLWEYAAFFGKAFFKLTGLNLKKRYDIVHVHNMPDFLVFTALIPRLFGARVILDLHDPMPELFITKYGVPASHRLIRTLVFIERLSIRFATRVLTPNIAFRDLFVERGCPPEKIEIVMNTPMARIFNTEVYPDMAEQDRESFTIMFHGTIVARHGLETALFALVELRDRIPGLVFSVFGAGDYLETFLRRVEEMELQNIVRYNGVVTNEEIAEAISSAHLGIIPNLMSPFTNINLPVRIFEYLAMGKPVIVPRTKGIQDYFGEEEILYFNSGDVDSLVQSILSVYQNPDLRAQFVTRGQCVYEKYRWSLQRELLIDTVEAALG